MIGMQCDKCKTLIDTTVMVNQDGRCFKCGHPYEPILLARWEERQKVLAEVEGWLVDSEAEQNRFEKSLDKKAPWYKLQSAEMAGRNELRAELRAKLAEMKGGK